ncbi:MAG: hypothetical protein ICV83_02635 [Cytophagales bacterium]|nr:hypothetical protein [Cytophagales bacterium]
MGLLYDITKDYLYQEGLTKGKEEEKREFIARLLATGEFSTDQLARYARVTVAYVEAIAPELKK